MEEKYEKLCSGDACYKMVKEDDIERYEDGRIYERSTLFCAGIAERNKTAPP